MKLKQGDIVLIKFPFSDLKGKKVRPAIVVSNKIYKNGNYILASITSNLRNDHYSYAIGANNTNGGLRHNSEIRTNVINTLHESIIIKKIAELEKAELKKVLRKIGSNIS